MLPGPNIIYKCPQCAAHCYRKTLRTYNTFCTRFYSDSQSDDYRLIGNPRITWCLQCSHIFWLNEKNLVFKEPMLPWGELQTHSVEKGDRAYFLGIDGYFEAIENKVYSNSDEELELRRQLWQCFNDSCRRRPRQKMFPYLGDQARYQKNCYALLELLSHLIKEKITNKDDEAILQYLAWGAELLRNVGQYKECLKLMGRVPKIVSRNKWSDQKYIACEDFLPLFDTIQRECALHKSLVVEVESNATTAEILLRLQCGA